jgi:Nif-specific regulatory protein
MVEEGFFREDLYHRVAGVTLELPSLRDRGPEEIEYLAKCFLAVVNAKQGKRLEWSAGALAALRGHLWPGNVRELLNVTNRAAALCAGSVIERSDLLLRPHVSWELGIDRIVEQEGYDGLHDEIDRRVIAKVLEECGGSVSEAARRLRMGRKKLTSRIAVLGLRHLCREYSE